MLIKEDGKGQSVVNRDYFMTERVIRIATQLFFGKASRDKRGITLGKEPKHKRPIILGKVARDKRGITFGTKCARDRTAPFLFECPSIKRLCISLSAT